MPPPASRREPVADEGLGIFGGVTTTEVPDDESDAPPPRQRAVPSARRRERHRARARAGTRRPRSAPTWNQPITPPPVRERRGGGEEAESVRAMLRSMRWAGDAGGRRRAAGERARPAARRAAAASGGCGPSSWWSSARCSRRSPGAGRSPLTLAILAGIVDTIYRSRNAATYRQRRQPPRRAQADQQAAAPRCGARDTSRSTRGPSRTAGSSSTTWSSGPTGVYAIDSEKWDAKLPVRTLNGKRLYLGPESQKERLEHAVWEASQASEILSAALGYECTVRPALAIYGPKIPWDIATIRNVDVFTGTALRKYLKRRGRSEGRRGAAHPRGSPHDL